MHGEADGITGPLRSWREGASRRWTG